MRGFGHRSNSFGRRFAVASPAACDDGSDMGSIKSELEDKRAKLLAEIDRISAPPDDAAGISFGKRVGDGTSIAVERLVQVATHDQVQAALADVDRALAKLDEATYGSCDDCGDPIAPERLEALPWAVVCVRCAGRRRRPA